MTDIFYQKSHAQHLNQLEELAPNQTKAFSDFNKGVFKEGVLTTKEKEIIAVSIAHVTQCPYCIDTHTKNAKKEGASLEELVEAVMVTSAVEAGGAVTHGTNMHNALSEEADDTLYERSNLKHLNRLGQNAKDAFEGYSKFNDAAMEEGKLSKKFKEIVAVAVGHATLCPYCIDVHTKNADKQGATEEELSEAVLVASAMLAGGSYAHMANMINSYGED
ncbi:alkylhydroperoxidase AhpD family core domain-containing protein [Lentibacillus persicus]|uniref:Alkylhydroperoxidase AhpD family core domain-containing protein n=1 Tax=Lentibacillus persicus TaxID=640948 RepID=A0A1I1XCZ9_9BACI|nr:carboxymuconolactone decarboxylase family protein [Lentibacillus persicus]SFE05212.1 alkylhydroperoxidase AhpD family core domain-containing protein [Lentibacillus persicus]